MASTGALDRRDRGRDPYASVLLSRLALHARRVLAVDRACLMVMDPARLDRMVVVEAPGVDGDVVGDRVPIAAELEFGSPGAGPGASMPIAGPAGPAGVLCVARTDPARRFERRDRKLLREMATLFAASLEDVRMGDQLATKVRACSDELARLAGMRARNAAGARWDLSAVASRIGARFGLDEAALIELGLAARLSELRGTGAADAALALTPGFEAVGLVLRLADERWDGSGQPYGLEAGRIPLTSRILAACRNFSDAAIAVGPFDALRRVHASSGSAFDPAVVGALWRDFCDFAASVSAKAGAGGGGDAFDSGGDARARARPRCAGPSAAPAP